MQKLHIAIDINVQILHTKTKGDMQMKSLKELRNEKNLTQREAANILGISLRSYISYENDESKASTLKYRFYTEELIRYNPIDEEHGILKTEDIIDICDKIFREYGVNYCLLFGSYAKGRATGGSDVDLLISTETTGLKYFELVERLRQQLHKKVDVLDTKQLLNNPELLDEVLKDGIRIYG